MSVPGKKVPSGRSQFWHVWSRLFHYMWGEIDIVPKNQFWNKKVDAKPKVLSGRMIKMLTFWAKILQIKNKFMTTGVSFRRKLDKMDQVGECDGKVENYEHFSFKIGFSKCYNSPMVSPSGPVLELWNEVCITYRPLGK